MATPRMKSNKRFFNAAVAFALAASMALPFAAGAQVGLDVSVGARPDDAGFCKGLAAMAAKVEERVAAGTSAIAAKRAEAQTRLDERKTSHDTKLAEARAKEDEMRDERVADLEVIADTDAEKQALEKFQADVAAAVTVRRAATDLANEAFRDGLKAKIAARASAVDAATTTFNAAVRAALAKAKADCASGVSPASVRTTLMASLKAAREKMQSDLQEIAKLGPQVKALIDVRVAAHEKAMADFHASLDAAKAELKAAFDAS